MNRIDSNFHTHTYRCKHASGDVIDYVRHAAAQGARILGFTDHAPLMGGARWWDKTRMGEDELAGYLSAIDQARELFPDLIILKGLECEYLPQTRKLLRSEFLERHGCDYLIAGAHCLHWHGDWVGVGLVNSAPMLAAYRDQVVDSIQSGLFAFIAHPDMFGSGYHAWDRHAEDCARAICEAAERCRVPLEINGYGLRKQAVFTPEGERKQYPLRNFWRIAAKHDIEVVCSSDAHRPDDVLASIPECRALAEEFGLKLADLPLRLGLNNRKHQAAAAVRNLP